jgi:hypothetical protein
MLKRILWISALIQSFISTSLELIGNERGEIVVDPVEPKVEEPKVEPKEEPKVPSKNELLRELSKEYGVNLFEPEGIQKFKDFQDSQKSAQEKLQEQLQAYETEKAELLKKQAEYEGKLKATELGIAQDKLEDALKLANGNPDNLVEVVKKYPIFKSTKGINIGVQDPATFQEPKGNDEAAAYMANNPRLYGKYIKK